MRPEMGSSGGDSPFSRFVRLAAPVHPDDMGPTGVKDPWVQNLLSISSSSKSSTISLSTHGVETGQLAADRELSISSDQDR